MDDGYTSSWLGVVSVRGEIEGWQSVMIVLGMAALGHSYIMEGCNFAEAEACCRGRAGLGEGCEWWRYTSYNSYSGRPEVCSLPDTVSRLLSLVAKRAIADQPG